MKFRLIIFGISIIFVITSCNPVLNTNPTTTPSPRPTFTVRPTYTITPTEVPITVLEWPFDTGTPIASFNYFDLDKVNYETHIADWIDNNHLVTYNCIEVDWPDRGDPRYISFYRDSSNSNEALFADKHGGLDLNFPVGTPLLSRWDTEIYTEGDLNVVFLFNDERTTLKLGHIDYFSAGFERGEHYQVKKGDIVGYVKEENGYTMTHPSTGDLKYTEIHFEIALLKPSKKIIRGNYNGGTHYVIDGLVGECNPDPQIRWESGLEDLTWVNGEMPKLENLAYRDGARPLFVKLMSEDEITQWNNRNENK